MAIGQFRVRWHEEKNPSWSDTSVILQDKIRKKLARELKRDGFVNVGLDDATGFHTYERAAKAPKRARAKKVHCVTCRCGAANGEIV